MSVETNYMPYELLLKGYENCTLKEKFIWNCIELKHKILCFLVGDLLFTLKRNLRKLFKR